MKGICSLFVVVFFGIALRMEAAPARKILGQHVSVIRTSANSAPLDSTNRLNLAIGLPLRNQQALDDFLREVYNPASTNFHRYLKPGEFAEKFGPSDADYNAVVDFAQRSGFIITVRHASRMVLEVNASAAEVEKAFQVKMLTAPHPTENRKVFAPDSPPSVPTELPILEVGGLNNFTRAQPLSSAFVPLNSSLRSQAEWNGEGPSSTYIPKDFKAAYASDISGNGAGQSVGLLEFDTCYAGDVSAYEADESLPNTPLIHVRLPGATGTPGPYNVEAAADVEMAIGMAPGLASVISYEAPRSPDGYSSGYIGLLLRMAEDDAAAQLSSSWNPPTDSTLIQDQIFQQMAAQGQTFFQASGDQGAYADGVFQRADNPYITIVGGTTLSIEIWGYSGPGGEFYYPVYGGESVWNGGSSNNVSGGGISTNYSIPAWQQGLDMSGNGGSTASRNSPDVAMIADGVYVRADNGKRGALGGTSVSAPLWAGFTALMNQQAKSNGLPNVGFLNPALYTLGRGARYTTVLHDITGGNNTTTKSPNQFNAGTGYDLCTGWGSPVGQSFVDALTVGQSRLVVDQTNGFFATGVVGGPFNVSAKSFNLANNGWKSLSWAIVNIPSWLDVSASAGTLNSGDTTTVNVSLDASAANLEAGTYSATLIFSNLTDHTETPILFTVQTWQLGSVQVFLTTGAYQAGARWRVDGGNWQDNGAVVTGLIASNHVIDFSSVANWTTPSGQTITVLGNQTNIVQGIYQQQFGTLTVSLYPADAAIAGARWRVDGGAWLDSGAVASGLLTTNHTISFSTISGWDTPDDLTVTVGGNQSVTKTAAYGERYNFVTIAGQPGAPGNLDGTNRDAQFSSPNGIALVGSNLFVVDTGNNLIRELMPQGTNWIVSTIAGNAYVTGSADGTGTNAQFNSPWGISADAATNLYITDTGNQIIRRASLQGDQWAVSTIAGVPNYNWYPYDGDTNQARFLMPGGISSDGDGNLWVAQVTDNIYAMLRFMGHTGGSWYTTTAVEGIGLPYGVLQGQHGVYVVDASSGQLCILQGNPFVGGFYLMAMSDTRFAGPRGLTEDAQGNIYIADTENNLIRKLIPYGSPYLPNYAVSTIAGFPGVPGTNDGVGTDARFFGPSSLVVDPVGRLFVSDTKNHTIRVGTPTLTSAAVFAAPNVPAVQGAKFQMDGGAWTPVGTTFRVSPGNHSITFQPVQGWITPPDQTFNTSSNAAITGTYVQQSGSLQVTLGPSDAIAAGAAWRLDGGDWQPSGTIVSGIAGGQHTVSFAGISGWTTPSDQSVWISDQTNTVVSVYLYIAVDSTKPSVAVASPQPGQTWSDLKFTLSGTATDDVAVASVWYQINQSEWFQADGTSQWTSQPFALGRGTVTARIYAVDAAGNISPTNILSFNNTPSVRVALTSVGSGTVSPGLNGQPLTIGKKYSLTAKPAANWIFDHWSGDIFSTSAKISFTAQTNLSLQANFIANPYGATAGTYAGIFYDTNSATPPSSGFFSAKVTSKGTFSASLLVDGSSYHLSGGFSPQGTSSNYISRQFNSIVLQMSLDSAHGGEMVGDLTATQWKAHLIAYRSAFSKTQPAPFAPKYTLCFFPDGNPSALQPGGIGFGSATVSSAGSLNFAGTLGDGTAVSQSAVLSQEGYWPFYISLYSGTGVVLGWLQVSDATNDLHGSLVWMKRPQLTTNALYPAGFSVPIEVRGSSFNFTNGPVLNFNTGQISLEGGNLAAPLTNSVSLTGAASLSITTSSGVFHGSIQNPDTGKAISFNGAVLQNENAGYGFFLGTNESGSVSLTPADGP